MGVFCQAHAPLATTSEKASAKELPDAAMVGCHNRVVSTPTFSTAIEAVSSTETDILVNALRTNAVFFSVGIALAGVLVALTVFILNTRMARRTATIAAWREWVAETSAARMRIGQAFPTMRMSREDALRVRTLTPEPPAWRKRSRAQRARTQQNRRDISQILNGLERLAAASRLRIIDEGVLERLAGTRIPAAYVRFEEYILVARQGQPTRPAQPQVYDELTNLVSRLMDAEELDSLRVTRSTL